MSGPVLAVDNISKRFGGLLALDSISFVVNRGEIVGLVGPNGAGKTTLFDVISGSCQPTEGDIRLEGISVVGKQPNQIVRRGLARTFQATSLFGDETVLENVLRGAFSRSRTGFIDFLLQRPDHRAHEESVRSRAIDVLRLVGLDTHADSIARNLSYGHQKRLGVATALASEPTLLILDEPAAGLNPVEANEVADVLRRVHASRKISILLVEHNMRMVMSLCGRVVVLNYGKKIADGTPDEIRQNEIVLKAYLGTQ
ncbi:MAG: ABC transporter ATP-binding protein [Xanthobacteraceae bacterium]|nr:ABC transporter ATP-binding protein [Xanthobacteraceae bacterium]